ncbi:hypothetical protein BDV06DRAFT_187864 [Aspergillus oleicola]
MNLSPAACACCRLAALDHLMAPHTPCVRKWTMPSTYVLGYVSNSISMDASSLQCTAGGIRGCVYFPPASGMTVTDWRVVRHTFPFACITL